ncbi:MAG TPA: DUF6351 family protein [Candidatus Solibacter sp.]|nr:DUF6351 family protein [Candidatus Solibacter sp.]
MGEQRPGYRLRLAALTGIMAGLFAPPMAIAQAAGTAGAVAIHVLSTRPDLVSGGSALVEITVPANAPATSLEVERNGADVSGLFARRANGKIEGLLTGLQLGDNTVTASLAGTGGAQLTIVNHPIGGPIFFGPQLQPWLCPTGSTDVQCDAPATYTYQYMPVLGGGFQSYDPNNPPPSATIANTTTTEGVTVPFIIRQETGYIDRDQYAVATLWQPGMTWTAVAPQPQYNGRLVITHGASCDEAYGAATAPSVTDSKMLGGGFILMSNALDNAGHACNIVLQAEALIMTKEHVIDNYGEVRWTIGSGCSGGSLVQQQVANAYPGLYQGISPQCSFTDALSSGMEYVDYDALLRYWENPARWDAGDAWTPVQMESVIDGPNLSNPPAFTLVIPNNANPTHACPLLPAAQRYDPNTNPHGVRCTIQDYMVNALGRRPSDGFANGIFDNVGIQYGLKGLTQGLLSPAQFVDLNANIGGFTIDNVVQPDRSSADLTGLTNAYRSGGVDEANNLNQVAIIDLRGPDEGSFHDVYRTYAMRERLLRNFGTAANQVLWRGLAAIVGDNNYADQAVFALDTWLGRVDADHRQVPLSQKIIEDKQVSLTDRCTDGAGTDIPAPVCDATVAAYGTPRFAAGEPLADDILKCQLQPLRRDDYNVTFTDAQWARLQKAFPTGVCNYGMAGVRQQPTVSWLTYQDATGKVIYGGVPMGPVPQSTSLSARGEGALGASTPVDLGARGLPDTAATATHTWAWPLVVVGLAAMPLALRRWRRTRRT